MELFADFLQTKVLNQTMSWMELVFSWHPACPLRSSGGSQGQVVEFELLLSNFNIMDILMQYCKMLTRVLEMTSNSHFISISVKPVGFLFPVLGGSSPALKDNQL